MELQWLQMAAPPLTPTHPPPGPWDMLAPLEATEKSGKPLMPPAPRGPHTEMISSRCQLGSLPMSANGAQSGWLCGGYCTEPLMKLWRGPHGSCPLRAVT